MLDNKLTFELIKSTEEVNNEIAKNINFKIGQNNHHLLSKKQKYIINISRYFNQITNLAKNLNHIELFLRRFPNRKFYESNDISELTYCQYHLEVLFHKVHTILELKKLFLNELYELGIPEKDCSWNNLKNRKEIKKSKAYPILNSYYSTFKDLIEARHLNTHRAIFDDSQKDSLDSSLFIYSGYEFLNLEVDEEYKNIMPKRFLNLQIKSYRNEKLKFAKNTRIKVENYVKIFFNSIVEDFITIKNSK